jgi:hypothetical protein
MFTATVSPAAAGGTVTFFDNGVQIGSPATLSGGTASINYSGLTPGTHTNITAHYAGNASYNPSDSSALTFTVNQATPSVTLTTSGSPSTQGQPVTFTATVTSGVGSPTGTVTFTVDGTPGSPVPLSGTTATFSTSTLGVGGHSVFATYNGDTNFVFTTSNTVSQQVNAAAQNTTTTLAALPTSSTFGQSVSFTATVSPAAATGTVTFFDNGNQIGSMPLSGGTASINYAGLSTSTHTNITAHYSGDASFNPSTSSPLTFTVGQATPTVNLGTSGSPSTQGQSVTFTATVTSGVGSPTGTVTFTVDGTAGSPVSLIGTTATFSTSTLGVGGHSVFATYNGDTNFALTVSNTVSQQVNPPANTNTTTTLAGNPNPVVVTQSVTFTATVTPAAATGSVIFYDGANPISPAVTVSGGTAQFSTSALALGGHTITAQYTPTGLFNGSGSNTVSQQVNPAATGVGMASTASPAFVGQSVTFTATVTATPSSMTPAGTVTFLDGANPISGAITLTNVGGQMKASFTTAGLSTGSHTINAQYSPTSPNFAASSGSIPEAVTQIPTSVSLSADPPSGVPGTTVTLTAQVFPVFGTGVTPTGTVTFVANGTTVGVLSAGSGQITLPVNGLGAGSYTFTATYSGDANYNGSVSAGAAVRLAPTAPPPPPPFVAPPVAVGGSADGVLLVFGPDGKGGYNGSPIGRFQPFGAIPTEVRAAVADVNGDGTADYVVVTGAGTKAAYAVINGKDGSFLVPPSDPVGDADFTAGLYVSAGDIDGDGKAEWVISPEDLGGPRTIIFDLQNGTPTLVSNHYGIGDPDFRGGERTALGDINGDGFLDVICIAAAKGGPRMAIFDGKQVMATGTAGTPPKLLSNDMFVADPASRNGLFIAAGDVNGDGFADVIATNDPLVGNGAEVRVLSGADLKAQNFTPAVLGQFTVSGVNPAGGLRVGSTNLDGDKKAEVVVGSGSNSPSSFRVYLGKNIAPGAGEPASLTLDPYGGAALTDGVFVG